MNSYDLYVTESLAKESVRQAGPHITITTREFARIQPVGDEQPAPIGVGMFARLRGSRLAAILVGALRP